MQRTLTITGLLAALGALAGALAGGVVIAVTVALKGPGQMTVTELLATGAAAGFVAGLVVTPALAWSALRALPLWRAAVEPAVVGSLAFVTAAVLQVPLLPSIAASVTLASAAALRLRLAARPRATVPTGPAPHNEEL